MEPLLQEFRPLAGWSRYDRWIEAIADVVFDPATQSGRPVYLDLEPEVIEALGERLSLAAADVVSALASDVRAVSNMDSNKAFEALLRRYLRWRRGDLRSVPPTLPLLAVFSLAAEQMGETDGINPNNYYARLVHLLDGETHSVAASYRDVAERLWGGLNLWLERNDGDRGLPTAFALGHRHVGLAVSQALVREADRQRLPSFFVQFDLPPRSVVPPAELEVMLDAWINSLHSGAGAALTRLWRVPTNRSVLCEIAATELAEWTGAINETVPGRKIEQRARLVLMNAPGLRPKIHLSVAVPDRGLQAFAELTSSTEQQTVDVPLDSFREGLSLLGESDSFSHSDLLEGLLTLTVAGVGDVRRIPRRVVVLKHDDLTGVWIESVRVLLGDALRLLVHKDRLDDVRRALGEMARPNWIERDELAGLPDEWVEFSDVEIFGRPTTPIYSSSDLFALLPATSRQLQLAGGIKVPGRVRNRWHVRRAPELRAVSDAAVGFTIRLLDLGATADESADEFELESWSSDDSNVVVVDLGELDLAVGDYALVMQEEGSKDANQRLTFSLRSSAMPDLVSQQSAVSFQHDWSAPLAVAGADGGPVEDAHAVDYRLEPLDERPWWRFRLRDERAATIGLSRPPQNSCFYTGKHIERIERVQMDAKNRPLTSTTVGRCTQCGAERVYQNDYWKLQRAKARADEAAAVVVRPRGGVRPPVHVKDQSASWETALDLLVYFGGGDYALLQRIAAEVSDGTTFSLQFVRALEGLGHISVQRSPATMSPTIWHVDPRSRVEHGRRVSLLGSWSEVEIDLVRRAGSTTGTDDDVEREVPPIRQFDGGVASQLGAGPEWDAPVLEQPSRSMLERAASLSRLVPELHRVPALSTLNLERFDPLSASWLPTIDSSSVGAYRTVGRARSYYVRTHDDVRDGTAAVIDPYTAKHIAAVALSGKALAAYDPRSRELITPVGADLPVLYDRAVVIETQRPPFVRRGYLIYADVAPEVAARIGYLLTH